MTYQTLEIESRDGVATVWMNRAEAHNAFNETLIGELTGTFEALERDPDVRLIVLAGRGKSFSAGADLEWMSRAAGYSEEENRRDARKLSKMYVTIHRLLKPTIARVHGAALGGGVGLTAACDIVVASTRASFATTEVKLGMIPSVISPYVIAAIGQRQAHRYFLTAERFDAAEAHRIGLVHLVCEPEDLDKQVAVVAETLIANSPMAQSAAKELIYSVADHAIGDVLIEDTAQRIAKSRATAEAKEGIAAFLEKRKPRWRP
ncbi:MAG: enoyl-CoA hydratase [Candidatus Muproteobacteria bacterium RBG_16_60_9]|uniref:Enoyl-CoA hydratase n=1 Tax=Candidatus Muproteobacteria bacterium RBG_16_60_9 TaxID=1817755 RepID=A0A1F6UVQ8_9PROT|nr:MAG: enoyl-CoA hydratase [Candidatus Muproteobacteria bacterium RBG_16_60_9]